MGLVEAVLVAVELGRANVSQSVADTALIATPRARADAQTGVARRRAQGGARPSVNPWIADLDQADMFARRRAARLPHPAAQRRSAAPPVRPVQRPTTTACSDRAR